LKVLTAFRVRRANRVFLVSVGLIRAVLLSSLVRPGRMPHCRIKYRPVARTNSPLGRTLFRPPVRRPFCLGQARSC